MEAQAAKDSAWWEDAANQVKNKAEIATLLQLKAELELVEARCAGCCRRQTEGVVMCGIATSIA